MALEPLHPDRIRLLSDDELLQWEQKVLDWECDDRKQNALLRYKPNNERVMLIHRSLAKTKGIFGGNRSSKSDSCLAEIAARSTGTIPESLKNEDRFLSKLGGPIQIRVVCESITTTLNQVMLRKLQWWKWSGIDKPGDRKWLTCPSCKWCGRGWQLKPDPKDLFSPLRFCPGCLGERFDESEREPRGHYGWIPPECLIDGVWEKSWSEKLRTLRVLYREPDDRNKVVGESSWQFMSKDQDVSDHASGEFNVVMLDEPPSQSIYEESVARVMSLGGDIYIAMTFPSDATFPIEWIFDAVYDKGLPGPNRDPNIETIHLLTTDNPNIDQYELSIRMGQMSEYERRIRIYGESPRFSNRIHPLFTDQDKGWCFTCGTTVIVENDVCLSCRSHNTATMNHVQPFDAKSNYPSVLLLDPHPRRPHMGLIVQIDPSDDWWIVDEVIAPGDPTQFREAVDAKEREHKVRFVRYLMDPNMGGSPAGTNREITWQTEFHRVQLPFELADDGAPGRALVDERLKPDRHTLRPRLIVHPRCVTTILQMKRWCWSEDRNPDRRGLKQKPDDKHSDMPTLLKYLANDFPTFQGYRGATTPIRYAEGSYASGSRRTRRDADLSAL